MAGPIGLSHRLTHVTHRTDLRIDPRTDPGWRVGEERSVSHCSGAKLCPAVSTLQARPLALGSLQDLPAAKGHGENPEGSMGVRLITLGMGLGYRVT